MTVTNLMNYFFINSIIYPLHPQGFKSATAKNKGFF